jgi:adenosylhomocysteine nucleosidase
MADIEVLVVTALKLERLAVRAHLEQLLVEDESTLAMDIGVFRAADRDVPVAVLQTGAGNVDAAVLTTRAEEFCRPALVLMVGIAGGIKDVEIGDVVASEKVYWLEAGKDADDWRPRIDVAQVSDSLRQVARGVAADGEWSAALGTSRQPEALVAPVAAGEKVLANRRSVLVQRIRRDASDAVCVDMEDYGTLRAGAATERTRTLAVRGISDLLDNKGEVEQQGSQGLAAANAAAFAFELIDRAGPTRQAPASQAELAALLAGLYPQGPSDSALWERVGGDPAALDLTGVGRERWWRALTLVRKGGGPTLMAVLAGAIGDFPSNEALLRARDAVAASER